MAIGQKVKCRIIAFDSEKNIVDLSIKDANKQLKKKYKHANFQVGQIVVGIYLQRVLFISNRKSCKDHCWKRNEHPIVRTYLWKSSYH